MSEAGDPQEWADDIPVREAIVADSQERASQLGQGIHILGSLVARTAEVSAAQENRPGSIPIGVRYTPEEIMEFTGTNNLQEACERLTQIALTMEHAKRHEEGVARAGLDTIDFIKSRLGDDTAAPAPKT